MGPILGENARALEHCEKSLQLDPLSPIVITTTGRILWGLDRLEDARRKFERAGEIDETLVVSRIYRAYMNWLAFAKFGEAVRLIRESFRLDPGNLYSIAGLGELYLDVGDTDRAAFWIDRFVDRLTDKSVGAMHKAMLHMRRGEWSAATKLARGHYEPGRPESAWTLRFLRDEAIELGQPGDARELYAMMYPELLDERISELTTSNFEAAVDLAFVLDRFGDSKQADRLVELAKRHLRTLSRSDSDNGFGIADVLIHSIQGDTSLALSSLREAIDENWRYQWWFDLGHDPTLKSLRAEPEFQAIVRELEAEMEAQLARIREMEMNGEFPSLPERRLFVLTQPCLPCEEHSPDVESVTSFAAHHSSV